MMAQDDLLDDALVKGLRSVLKASDDQWRGSLNRLIGSTPDPILVHNMRLFLTAHLAQTGQAHTARMTEMVDALVGVLTEMGTSDPVVEKLVGEIAVLQDKVSDLSLAVRSAKDALVDMLGIRTRRVVGDYRISVGQPHHSVRVVDGPRVPQSLRSLQVDRRLVLKHFKSTGEVPPGIEINETRPAVVVKPAASQ